MSDRLGELVEAYTVAFQDYFSEPAEVALARAYELGRMMLTEGLGVLAMRAPVLGVTACACAFVITGWMLKTYLTHRENMKGLSMTKQGLASSDQRLGRVEQAVEAIAIEIERISEGQRYVTKLLNGRAQLPADGGPVTARALDSSL